MNVFNVRNFAKEAVNAANGLDVPAFDTQVDCPHHKSWRVALHANGEIAPRAVVIVKASCERYAKLHPIVKAKVYALSANPDVIRIVKKVSEWNLNI